VNTPCTARLLKGSHSISCTPRSSVNGMNHTVVVVVVVVMVVVVVVVVVVERKEQKSLTSRRDHRKVEAE